MIYLHNKGTVSLVWFAWKLYGMVQNFLISPFNFYSSLWSSQAICYKHLPIIFFTGLLAALQLLCLISNFYSWLWRESVFCALDQPESWIGVLQYRLPVLAGVALRVTVGSGASIALHTPLVNEEIRQILHDEIAAPPATKSHLKQLPLMLESGQCSLENGKCQH